MIEVFKLIAQDREEFLAMSKKMGDTLARWSEKYPKFDYAFVGSSETLEITIEVAYNKGKYETEDNSEDNSQSSKGSSNGDEYPVEGRFRSSDFSI